MMVPVGRLVLLRSGAKTQLVNAMAGSHRAGADRPGAGAAGRRLHRLLCVVALDLLSTCRSASWASPWPRIHSRITRAEHAAARFHRPSPLGTALSWLIFGCESAGAGVGPLSAALTCSGSASLALRALSLYARRAADPILDLALMRVPTFALSVIAGSLSRITAGALPFLLPLMMQIGFGMSALRQRPLDLHERGRLDGDEGQRRAPVAAPLRLPHRPDLERADHRRFCWCALRRVPPRARSASSALLLVGGFLQSLQFTATIHRPSPMSRMTG